MLHCEWCWPAPVCDYLLSKELLTDLFGAHGMCVGCLQITVCKGWFVLYNLAVEWMEDTHLMNWDFGLHIWDFVLQPFLYEVSHCDGIDSLMTYFSSTENL